MKMNLHETIRLLIKEQGTGVVNSPAFMGILDDYGAFREEEPATRTIVRELVRTGQMQRFIDSPNKGRNLHFEIRTIISETARSGGFREDLVSDTLKRIALGTGKIHKEQDWPTLNEEKGGDDTSTQVQNQPVLTTEELSTEEWNAVLKSMNAVSRKPSKSPKLKEPGKSRIPKSADPFTLSVKTKKTPLKPSAKANLQPAVTVGAKIKAKSGPSVWQRVKRGIYYHADLWCMIPVVICFCGAIMTLFLSVFAFFAGSPEAGYWAKWLLVCIVTGILVFITYYIVDEHEEWFIDKQRR